MMRQDESQGLVISSDFTIDMGQIIHAPKKPTHTKVFGYIRSWFKNIAGLIKSNPPQKPSHVINTESNPGDFVIDIKELEKLAELEKESTALRKYRELKDQAKQQRKPQTEAEKEFLIKAYAKQENIRWWANFNSNLLSWVGKPLTVISAIITPLSWLILIPAIMIDKKSNFDKVTTLFFGLIPIVSAFMVKDALNHTLRPKLKADAELTLIEKKTLPSETYQKICTQFKELRETEYKRHYRNEQPALKTSRDAHKTVITNPDGTVTLYMDTEQAKRFLEKEKYHHTKDNIIYVNSFFPPSSLPSLYEASRQTHKEIKKRFQC